MANSIVCSFTQTLRRRIMGEKFWKKKEKRISNIDDDRERRRRQEEQRLLRERRSKIRSEIGWLTYYLKRQACEQAAREFPEPVVTLDDAGQVKVEWRYTLNIDKDCDSEEIDDE